MPECEVYLEVCVDRAETHPCTLGRTWWTHREGEFLYVNDENTGLYISTDIDNPERMHILCRIEPFEEFHRISDDVHQDAFNDIDVEDQIGYVALDNGGMLIIDLSNVDNPELISHYDPWKEYD